MAASHAALGNHAEAEENIKRVLELDREATVKKWTSFEMAPYKNPKDRQHFRDNLQKAGLPEK